mgnify:CR=1 FL=1
MRFSKVTLVKVLLCFFVIGGAFWGVSQIVHAQDLNTGLNFASNTGLANVDPRVTVARVIRIGLGFLGVLAVGLIMYAGFLWMSAKGNEEKVEQAKKILTSAAIGLAIILAAFGIASFILSKLLEATGGGGGGDGSVCSPACAQGQYCCAGACQAGACGNLIGGNKPFMVRGSVPGDGTVDVPRNAVIRFQFTKDVQPQSVNNLTFAVRDGDQEINGQRTVIGDYIEFRPTEGCGTKAEGQKCFPANTTITVEARNNNYIPSGQDPVFGNGAQNGLTVGNSGFGKGIMSVQGDTLICGSKNEKCAISFTIGDTIDTEVPRVNLANHQICAQSDSTLEASAIDNTGVSKIDFYVAGNLVGSRINNTFPFIGSPYNASFIWNAAGIQAGQNIALKATAYDLDSNNASAERTIKVSASHCCNGLKDGDETGTDCGGSCMACAGQACAADKNSPAQCSDAMCSSGFCSTSGSTPATCAAAGYNNISTCCLCQARPQIDWVSPVGGFCSNNQDKFCRAATAAQDCGTGSCNLGTPNGAAGNFITIGGSGFGSARGKVYFTGARGKVEADLADDAQLGNIACAGEVWTDNQIIAVVPAGAQAGPITVEKKDGISDATDDGYGSLIDNFRKNSIIRPGICTLSPDSAQSNKTVVYNGINLLSSEANFGNFSSFIPALESSFTSAKSGNAKVPNLTSGPTTSFVNKAGVPSNFISFVKENDPYSGPIISSIEPSSGPVGQYVTVRGSGFGDIQGTSKLFFGDTSGKEADYNFPEICSQSVWTDKQIIIKVPASATLGNTVLTIIRDGFTPVSSGERVFQVTTGNPNPGLCRIDPSLGQPNNPVTLWGEYFQNKDANSKITFFNNQSQSGGAIAFWDIDQEASGIKPWKVVTMVPTSAATGPVVVGASSPAQLSNSLNFAVGSCSKDADCGSGATCCAAGLPEAGKCKADAAACYGTVATSVYQWQFGTGTGQLSCQNDQEACGTYCCGVGKCDRSGAQPVCSECPGRNQCGDGNCCSGACKPGIGIGAPSYCGDPASCSGYNGAQCVDGYTCPNSPGMCSPTPSTQTCDCCCDKNNHNPQNPGCCAGLTCGGSCGSGADLGLCLGCVVNGVPNDDKCNCPGTTGKVCTVNITYPMGACTDCSSITDPAECSKHTQCCVDGREGPNKNKCTSLAPGQPRITDSGGSIKGDTGKAVAGTGNETPTGQLQYCGFFACTNQNPNSCNPLAVKDGPYNVLTTCNQQCAAAPIPCSGNKETCSNPQCPTNMRCDTGTCECKPDGLNPPQEICKNPFTQQCTEGCAAAFTCLTPNYGNIGGTSNELPDETCRCCCKPPTGPNDVDTCKTLDESLSCLKDQGACTGENRGACCGCSKDSQCGDVGLTGCGITGNRCCQARPTVKARIPAPASTDVCRNPVIEATFSEGQKMDINTFSGNVLLIGDYGGASECPNGYSGVTSISPTNKFASLWYGLKRVVIKAAPFLAARPAFADVSKFCYVSGSAIGYDISANQTKVRFRLNYPLDANRKYYVVLKGDPALATATPNDGVVHYNQNITNIAKVGLNGTSIRRVPGVVPAFFNNTEFKNADTWTFETGNKICSLDSVKIDPSSYLFQKTGQEKTLDAYGQTNNGQLIDSIEGKYAWSWSWESGNSDIVKVEDSTSTHAVATAGNSRDAQTVARAKATIVVDTLNSPSTTGKVAQGTSQLRVFLCANPWPVYYAYFPPPEYQWPWKNETTGIEFYYCRDKDGAGTNDDLPAIQEAPLSQSNNRKVCMSGSNLGKVCTSDANCGNVAGSCWPEVLKEFFFFREVVPGVPVITGSTNAQGGKVILRWQPTANAQKYKIYYGLQSGNYTKTAEVTGTGRELTKEISSLVNGLNYYFVVTALTSKNQESAFSNELKLKPVDTTPPAVPVLRARPNNTDIILSWDSVPEATSYIASWGAQSGQYSISNTIAASTTPTHTFSGFNSGSTYYVSVRSVDQYGNKSAYASEVSVTIP